MSLKKLPVSFLLFSLSVCTLGCLLTPTPTPTVKGAATEATEMPAFPTMAFSTSTPISTPTPLHAFTMTPTIVNSTSLSPTIIVSPTMDVRANSLLITNCLPVTTNDQIPAFSGKLLLLRTENEEVSFLDMLSMEEMSLMGKNEMLTGLAISPNRSRLAYKVFNSQSGDAALVISNFSGDRLKSIDWSSNWHEIVNWVDDDWLMISRSEGELSLDAVFILNPDSGEQKDVSSTFPDINWLAPRTFWEEYNFTMKAYSSDLTLVLYPTIGEFDRLSLWNVQKAQEITRFSDSPEIEFMGLLGITPRWSPDNSLVITSASLSNTSSSYTDQEIIGIFRDGQFERLTYLTDSYPSVQISNASWSPDGKYLAFGFSSDENTSYPDLYPNELPQSTHFRLAVLDIQTRIVTNYCVPLGKYAWVKPIWSPNGNQIALPDVYYHEGDVERKYLYIVDIKAGNVVPIFENAIPIGWLNEGY